MNIFRLELRNMRKSVLSWTISIGVVIYAMLAFFPSLQTDSMQALANAKLEGIDPALLAALGLQEIPDFTVVTNFFGYVLQFIVLAIMVFVTQHAVNSLVREETEGTIEFLYAKPVSRIDIFVQKELAHLAVYLGMLVVYAVCTVIGYLSFSDFEFAQAVKESAIFFGAVLFVGLIFMAVGILASTLVKSSRGGAGVTISIVFGTFILGMMSAVIKELEFLRYFSPMDWIKTQKLMGEGITPTEWGIGIAIIVLCPLLAALRYRKKDLLVS